MYTKIKKQAKKIIGRNKILFIPSIILLVLRGVVPVTKSFWSEYYSGTVVFVITELSIIILFPLVLGYIKALFQVKENQPFKVSELFYIYRSPYLLFKSIGLVFIVNVLIDLATFIETNLIFDLIFKNIMGFILLIITILISLYLLLTNYLFVLKSDSSLGLILKQSVKLIKGKVWDYILLSLSFSIWFIPGLILLFIALRPGIRLTPQYFIYYGMYHLYMGCVLLYYDLAIVIFAEKVINNDYDKNINYESIYYKDSEISDDDEIGLEYNLDYEQKEKQKQFEHRQMLPREYIVFTDITADVKSYNVDLRYDTYELYYFLREYGKIRNLFIKTYEDIVYYNEKTSENVIYLNNNKFRLIISINWSNAINEYDIKFEFYIND